MELSRNDTQLLSKEIVYLIPEAVVVCEAAVTVPVLRYALCCTAVLYGDVGSWRHQVISKELSHPTDGISRRNSSLEQFSVPH